MSDEPPTILPIPPGPFIYHYTHRKSKEMRETIRRALKDLNPEIRGLGNLTYGMWSITFFIAAVGFVAFMLSLVVALSHSKSLLAESRLIPTASSSQTLLAAYTQASAFLPQPIIRSLQDV